MITLTVRDVLDKKLPNCDQHFVYRFSDGDSTLYVGKSFEIENRIYTHLNINKRNQNGRIYRTINRNKPQSLDWTITLYAIPDLEPYLAERCHNMGWDVQKLLQTDLSFIISQAEIAAIGHFQPKHNVVVNNKQKILLPQHRHIVQHQKGDANALLSDTVTDDTLISMWLDGFTENTKDSYIYDAKQFLTYCKQPIKGVTTQHIHDYIQHMQSTNLKPGSIRRKIKCIKSLLSFARNTGYTAFNAGTVVRIKRSEETVDHHILSAEQVEKIIASASTPQYQMIIQMLYSGALRVSELCGLQWKCIEETNGLAQVALYDKGEITRHVLLDRKTGKQLLERKQGKDPESYVFISQKKGPFDPAQINRIVNDAAVKAGVETYPYVQIRKNQKTGQSEETHILKSRVSPQWLRHAHAMNAISNGVPVDIVSQTLGHQTLERTAVYMKAVAHNNIYAHRKMELIMMQELQEENSKLISLLQECATVIESPHILEKINAALSEYIK